MPRNTLSPNAGRLLQALFIKGPPVPVRYLARQAGLRLPSAERAIRELLSMGFVEVSRADTGPLVAMTGAGAEAALAARNARALRGAA